MAKTKEEKIQKMLEGVDDWPLDMLLNYVRASEEAIFSSMTSKSVDVEYTNRGYPEFDNDDAPAKKKSAPKKKQKKKSKKSQRK